MVAFVSLYRAMDYIESHLSDTFTPEDVAHAAFLSTSQLNRLFHRAFGVSPAAYILKRRLCLAATALSGTRRPITDIALDAQFSAPESFTRAFRRQYLMTPSQYRRRGARLDALYPPLRLPGLSEGSKPMHKTQRYDISQVREAILSARGTYLMVADMDHLMHINDTLGSAAGDAALAALAARIEHSLGEGMSFYRTGNDDFTILTRTADHTAVDRIAQRILDQSAQDVPYPGGSLRMTASLGIAMIGQDTQDAQRPLDAAGRAMARAKRMGRNRYAFDHGEVDAAEHILAARGTYILLCDMDGLKAINDTLGYEAGDAAIAALSARIQESIGPDMRALRTGGDEYTILTGSADRAACEAIARAILSHADEAVAYPGGTLRVSASLGIALVPQDIADADLAIEQADEALMAAKLAGRGGYRLFEEA